MCAFGPYSSMLRRAARPVACLHSGSSSGAGRVIACSWPPESWALAWGSARPSLPVPVHKPCQHVGLRSATGPGGPLPLPHYTSLEPAIAHHLHRPGPFMLTLQGAAGGQLLLLTVAPMCALTQADVRGAMVCIGAADLGAGNAGRAGGWATCLPGAVCLRCVPAAQRAVSHALHV